MTVAELPRNNTASGARRGVSRRLLAAGAAGVVVLAGGAWGANYWTVGRFFQTTDDAYVKADASVVAPKVAGYIGELLVQDNQPVALAASGRTNV